jgi:hypothetical protein
MALNAKDVPSSGGGNKHPLEAGNYPGRLVAVIDLGLQAQRPFNGEEKAPANEIGVTYELADEFMKDEQGQDLADKPRWISESFPFFNLKATKATSTKRYKALDPTEKYSGDWAQLIGMPCNVTIVVNDKGNGKIYENVAGISPMRPKDADKAPPLVNKPIVFDLDAPDLDTFKRIPKWQQDKIKANLNYRGSKLEALLGKDPEPKKEEPKAKAKAVASEEEAPY